MGQEGKGLSCSANCRRVREVMRERGYVNGGVQEGGVDEYFVLPEFWDPALRKKEWRIHPPRSHGCRRR
jgi:hypothetical protein